MEIKGNFSICEDSRDGHIPPPPHQDFECLVSEMKEDGLTLMPVARPMGRHLTVSYNPSTRFWLLLHLAHSLMTADRNSRGFHSIPVSHDKYRNRSRLSEMTVKGEYMVQLEHIVRDRIIYDTVRTYCKRK